MLSLLLQTYWFVYLSSCRVPAAHQMVSVPAAGRPSVLRGHHQPLVDAEHVLFGRLVHGADRDHRDPAAQHRPRAHRLHTHPRGRGPVMEAARVQDPWITLTQETITRDLCNRAEAEVPPQVYRGHCVGFRPAGSSRISVRTSLDLGVYQSGRALFARTPALSLAVLLNGKRTELCNLSLHSALSSLQRTKSRGVGEEIFKKSAF